MELTIAGARYIQEIQHDFNDAFPFLKIEFFKPQSSRTVHAYAANLLKHSLKINEARRLQQDGVMEIKDITKVSDLEKDFKEKFGLYVQVFRKSGNVWLETTMSDNWTLKQQNDHGREISTYTSKPLVSNDIEDVNQ
ncbi:MAG TPA: hypothetical protein VGD17_07945 [Chitinophagaceae bacterium]